MRLLALFFAFYFACLSCLSCTDEATVCKDQQQTTVAASHSDCGAGALGDWCSPLCQCACCAGVALPQPLLRVAFGARPAVAYASQGYAGQPRLAVPTRAPAAPWQPPQGV